MVNQIVQRTEVAGARERRPVLQASHRPYRPGKGLDAALAEVARGRGTAFDARVIDACLELFRERAFRLPDNFQARQRGISRNALPLPIACRSVAEKPYAAVPVTWSSPVRYG